MHEWYEFRLWYAEQNQNDIFAFKKTHLLPILERHGIIDFLTLDEQDFVLLRVNTSDEDAKRIFLDLEEAISSRTLFVTVTRECWSPEDDATKRIQSAGEKILKQNILPEGWVLETKDNGETFVTPQDLDKLSKSFSIFMSKVAGQFIKAYLKEMPYRVEDRWLMSVFIHLLLDSISTWKEEEKEIREFPYY